MHAHLLPKTMAHMPVSSFTRKVHRFDDLTLIWASSPQLAEIAFFSSDSYCWLIT